MGLEGLAELPPGGDDVPGGHAPTVADRHLERKALPVQVRIALPVLPPIPRHRLPSTPRTLDRHRPNVAGAAHVAHQHQVEVAVSADREPDSPFFHARHPALQAYIYFELLVGHCDGDDAGSVLCDVEEGRLGHVEVRAGRVAPAAVVAGESGVRRAEVGGRDDDGARKAPPRVVVAPKLVASAATEPIVEQHRAQRRRVGSVAPDVEKIKMQHQSSATSHSKVSWHWICTIEVTKAVITLSDGYACKPSATVTYCLQQRNGGGNTIARLLPIVRNAAFLRPYFLKDMCKLLIEQRRPDPRHDSIEVIPARYGLGELDEPDFAAMKTPSSPPKARDTEATATGGDGGVYIAY
ncbi:hypothetical protein ZIOFF_045362 [Zingiber officinale]|uniref:Uncharacterized protein n=1 Tax=Zingiber officinale TaxID=94328 RepID=A0A8J5GD19_ZINOF|nr:hypothetical protein ZIOFF_045362 [Zingiber officinale]